MKVSHVFRMVMVTAMMACAANQAAAMVEGEFETFTVKSSGLVSDDVRAVCAGADGQMWFGTASGLLCFDGKAWTTYTTKDGLAGEAVNALAYDPAGQALWIGTDSGVSMAAFAKKGVKFSAPFTMADTKYPGMVSNKITSVAVGDNQMVWFGSDLGLMSFDGKAWKSYTVETPDISLTDNHVNAVAFERTAQGSELWLGTNGGISHLGVKDGAVAPLQSYRVAQHPELPSDMILSAMVDSVRGIRWFGSDKGLIEFKDGVFRTYTQADMQIEDECVISAAPSASMAYFGTKNGGVARFDGVSTASPVEIQWSYIASNNVRGIALDAGGAVWFATDKGITKWIPPEF